MHLASLVHPFIRANHIILKSVTTKLRTNATGWTCRGEKHTGGLSVTLVADMDLKLAIWHAQRFKSRDVEPY